MQYQLYKPNSKNTGAAFSFRVVTQDKEGNPSKPTLFMQSIKQASWDDNKKTGSFSENAKDPEKNVYVKLNENEVGGIIHAIENYTEFSAFHSYNEDKTQISFRPYTKKDKDQTKAFSLGIVKNTSMKFGIGVEISEARTLKSFLELFLIRFFSYNG